MRLLARGWRIRPRGSDRRPRDRPSWSTRGTLQFWRVPDVDKTVVKHPSSACIVRLCAQGEIVCSPLSAWRYALIDLYRCGDQVVGPTDRRIAEEGRGRFPGLDEALARRR